MTTLLRILRLYSLALWVGGEVFFVVVAGIAFSVLPSAHLAGLVVRGSLIALHWIGIGSAVVYLVATLALMGRDRHGARLIEFGLVAAMLALTMYSQFSVIPRMERDRLSAGGDVSTAQPDNSARLEFERLHKLSVNLEGAVLLCGLVLIALAPIHDWRMRKQAD